MIQLKTRMRRLVNRLGYDMSKIPIGRPGRDLVLDIRQLAKNSVQIIFDVGANVGNNSLEYHREFPGAKIFCFEPFTNTYEELRRNVAGISGIIPLNAALGSESSSAVLNVNAGSDQNSLLTSSPEAGRFVGKEFFKPEGQAPISVRTVDAVCAEYSIERIDFMKVDTQGYEMQVLSGARRFLAEKRISILLLEVNFIPLYTSQPSASELLTVLESFNYGFVGFYNQVYHHNSFVMWGDALFVQRDLIRV